MKLVLSKTEVCRFLGGGILWLQPHTETHTQAKETDRERKGVFIPLALSLLYLCLRGVFFSISRESESLALGCGVHVSLEHF